GTTIGGKLSITRSEPAACNQTQAKLQQNDECSRNYAANVTKNIHPPAQEKPNTNQPPPNHPAPIF
ncbi:hypothetical protein RA275_28480, partial [Pseudomonas syringae pv. tagetis]